MKNYVKVRQMTVRVSLWDHEIFVWSNHEPTSIGMFKGDHPTKREENRAIETLREVSGSTFVGVDITLSYYVRKRSPRAFEWVSLAKKERPVIVKERSRIR